MTDFGARFSYALHCTGEYRLSLLAPIPSLRSCMLLGFQLPAPGSDQAEGNDANGNLDKEEITTIGEGGGGELFIAVL